MVPLSSQFILRIFDLIEQFLEMARLNWELYWLLKVLNCFIIRSATLLLLCDERMCPVRIFFGCWLLSHDLTITERYYPQKPALIRVPVLANRFHQWILFSFGNEAMPLNTYECIGSGGGTRTPDTRIMIPLL